MANKSNGANIWGLDTRVKSATINNGVYPTTVQLPCDTPYRGCTVSLSGTYPYFIEDTVYSPIVGGSYSWVTTTSIYDAYGILVATIVGTGNSWAGGDGFQHSVFSNMVRDTNQAGARWVSVSGGQNPYYYESISPLSPSYESLVDINTAIAPRLQTTDNVPLVAGTYAQTTLYDPPNGSYWRTQYEPLVYAWNGGDSVTVYDHWHYYESPVSHVWTPHSVVIGSIPTDCSPPPRYLAWGSYPGGAPIKESHTAEVNTGGVSTVEYKEQYYLPAITTITGSFDSNRIRKERFYGYRVDTNILNGVKEWRTSLLSTPFVENLHSDSTTSTPITSTPEYLAAVVAAAGDTVVISYVSSDYLNSYVEFSSGGKTLGGIVGRRRHEMHTVSVLNRSSIYFVSGGPPVGPQWEYSSDRVVSGTHTTVTEQLGSGDYSVEYLLENTLYNGGSAYPPEHIAAYSGRPAHEQRHLNDWIAGQTQCATRRHAWLLSLSDTTLASIVAGTYAIPPQWAQRLLIASPKSAITKRVLSISVTFEDSGDAFVPYTQSLISPDVYDPETGDYGWGPARYSTTPIVSVSTRTATIRYQLLVEDVVTDFEKIIVGTVTQVETNHIYDDPGIGPVLAMVSRVNTYDQWYEEQYVPEYQFFTSGYGTTSPARVRNTLQVIPQEIIGTTFDTTKGNKDVGVFWSGGLGIRLVGVVISADTSMASQVFGDSSFGIPRAYADSETVARAVPTPPSFSNTLKGYATEEVLEYITGEPIVFVDGELGDPSWNDSAMRPGEKVFVVLHGAVGAGIYGDYDSSSVDVDVFGYMVLTFLYLPSGVGAFKFSKWVPCADTGGTPLPTRVTSSGLVVPTAKVITLPRPGNEFTKPGWGRVVVYKGKLWPDIKAVGKVVIADMDIDGDARGNANMAVLLAAVGL